MTHTNRTLSLVVLVLLAAGTPARSQPAADALTRGKLQLDLGNFGNAAELFAKAAADSTATDPVRWEALTRLGLTRRILGDHPGSLKAFRQLVERFGMEPEAQRFVVENVVGLALTDAHWRLVQPGFEIEATEDPAHGSRLKVSWGTDDSACRAPDGDVAELSLDFKDALLGDVFRFLADFSGVPFEVDPCMKDMLITIRLMEQPWDAALRTIAGAYGLTCRYEQGHGFHMGCGPGAPTPEMTEPPAAASTK